LGIEVIVADPAPEASLNGAIAAMSPATRVFISSTSIDLHDYRQAVFNAIHSLGGFSDDMTYWTADERDGASASMARVCESDVLILIVAHRYGHVPAGQTYSVTELEYRAARKANIPVLAFVVDDSEPWPPRFIDRAGAAKLARFKKTIDKEVTRRTFRSPDELMALVTQSLVALNARRTKNVFVADPISNSECRPRIHWSSGPLPASSLRQ
jgi:hypothetical protein